MININDLRLGNYIQRSGEVGLLKVLCIGEFIDNKFQKNVVCENLLTETRLRLVEEQLEYIPLTSEILKKAGFVYHDNQDWPWEHSRVSFPLKETTEGEYQYYHLNAVFKYLHQIQNIYYLMTSEELELKIVRK